MSGSDQERVGVTRSEWEGVGVSGSENRQENGKTENALCYSLT